MRESIVINGVERKEPHLFHPDPNRHSRMLRFAVVVSALVLGLGSLVGLRFLQPANAVTPEWIGLTERAERAESAGPSNVNAPMRNPSATRECLPGNRAIPYKGVDFTVVTCDVFKDKVNNKLAPIVTAWNDDGTIRDTAGTLEPGKREFVCEITSDKRYNKPTTTNLDGTVNHNHRWLLTADFKGWVPATFISQGGDNESVPGVKPCPARR